MLESVISYGNEMFERMGEKIMASSVSRVSDILCSILVSASQKSGILTFTVRHIDFQRIFKNSVNTLSKDVIFSDSGPEPFSPILDDSLNH